VRRLEPLLAVPSEGAEASTSGRGQQPGRRRATVGVLLAAALIKDGLGSVMRAVLRLLRALRAAAASALADEQLALPVSVVLCAKWAMSTRLAKGLLGLVTGLINVQLFYGPGGRDSSGAGPAGEAGAHVALLWGALR
jgi:hypothetical protein